MHQIIITLLTHSTSFVHTTELIDRPNRMKACGDLPILIQRTETNASSQEALVFLYQILTP